VALFRDWGKDYEDAFINISRNSLRDSMAKFEVLQVFYNRTDVEKELKTNLVAELALNSAEVSAF